MCSGFLVGFAPPSSAIGRAHSRDRGSTFVTCFPRSHGEMLSGTSGAPLWRNVPPHRVYHTHTRGHVDGTLGAPIRLDDNDPPHTGYTRHGLHTPRRHSHTHRPHVGAARIASAILSTHLFCLRRLRLFMFNTSVITLTTAHCR